jgi:uncharacterized membrane protein
MLEQEKRLIVVAAFVGALAVLTIVLAVAFALYYTRGL